MEFAPEPPLEADDSYRAIDMDAVAKTILVGLGGFLGANARYWLGGWIQSKVTSTFPWQTLIVNVVGSLVIGLFMGLFLELRWSDNWRLLVAIGVLGGYTTYSSFAYEAVSLLSTRQYGWALLYVEGTALLTVFGCWIGIVLSRVLLGGRV